MIETEAGHAQMLAEGIALKGGITDAWYYDGRIDNFSRVYRLHDVALTFEPTEFDSESKSQVMIISGQMMYNYFGTFVDAKSGNLTTNAGQNQQVAQVQQGMLQKVQNTLNTVNSFANLAGQAVSLASSVGSLFGRRARRIEVIDIPMCKNTGDSANIFGVINECLVTYDNAMVVADTNGVGNELGKMLQQAGIYYKPVKWGGACFNNENKKLYANLRTQAYVCLGRAMKDGRFKMKTRKYANKYQDQMIKIPYSFDDQYRYKLKSKGDMAKEGIKSPDLGDALAFLFLEGVSYSVADSNKQSDELGTQRSERQQQFAQLQGVDISNL